MATKADAPSLLDVMTRHQLYLEGVKLEYGKTFDRLVAQQLRRDLREIFFDIEYDQLSAMTKRELERFIRRLRTAQIKRFDTFTQQVLNDLKEFMRVDTEMNAQMLVETQEADAQAEKDVLALAAKRKQDKLWALALSTIVQANGMTTEQLLARFKDNSVFALETTVRRAFANKTKTNAALAELLGTARLYNRDGLLTRLSPQAQGVVSTLLQHIAGIVQSSTAQIYYSNYRWVSVIDGVTSNICRSRNGKIYRYGDGPLPPAHPYCRSHTEPADDSSEPIPTSYYAWLKAQPDAVQDDILGTKKAAGLRNGDVKSSDVPKFNDASPLTLAAFKDKLKLVLAT